MCQGKQHHPSQGGCTAQRNLRRVEQTLPGFAGILTGDISKMVPGVTKGIVFFGASTQSLFVILGSTAFNFDKCEMWKSCTLDLGLFREVLGHPPQEPGSQEKTVRSLKKTALCQGGEMNLVKGNPWFDQDMWCRESLVGENTRKDINPEGSFPFFSLSCGNNIRKIRKRHTCFQLLTQREVVLSISCHETASKFDIICRLGAMYLCFCGAFQVEWSRQVKRCKTCTLKSWCFMNLNR